MSTGPVSLVPPCGTGSLLSERSQMELTSEQALRDDIKSLTVEIVSMTTKRDTLQRALDVVTANYVEKAIATATVTPPKVRKPPARNRSVSLFTVEDLRDLICNRGIVTGNSS